jgi:DNA-directed RNA polymerase alpha subunit
MAKIKEEQLKTIQEQQAKLQNILTEVGLVEVRKHELLHAQAVVAKEVEETKKELEEEYGSVNINMADGTYTKIEETDDSELSVVKSED